MILARLTSDPLIKLFGRELLLVEEIPSEEGTRFSIAEKLPPDLRDYCSCYYLEADEFTIEGQVEDAPCPSPLTISKGLNQLNNYSESIWEILDALGDQIGESQNYEAAKLQQIRLTTEQVSDQAQRLLKESLALHKAMEIMLAQNPFIQTAA